MADNSLKTHLSVVFVGHVDHGKSSVVGRLLADTHSLPEGKIEQIRERCKQTGSTFEYAFLIDALKDEQAQNITIDSARVFFQSELRDYIIIDAPGHVEFVKNMVTGAARAEAALLVIDAAEGLQENSRRHAYLMQLLGIQQIAVIINKMDKVNYDQEIFRKITADCDTLFKPIGLNPRCYIPVSAYAGDNISQVSSNMPWYNGYTLLSAMDSFEKIHISDRGPFRMPVQDIYKFTYDGDDRRIIAGTVLSGTAVPGDEIVFYPSGKSSHLKTIENYPSQPQAKLETGDHAGFTLEEQIFIRRGEDRSLQKMKHLLKSQNESVPVSSG